MVIDVSEKPASPIFKVPLSWIWGSKFFRNVGDLPDHTASHSRRPVWKPQISHSSRSFNYWRSYVWSSLGPCIYIKVFPINSCNWQWSECIYIDWSSCGYWSVCRLFREAIKTFYWQHFEPRSCVVLLRHRWLPPRLPYWSNIPEERRSHF